MQHKKFGDKAKLENFDSSYTVRDKKVFRHWTCYRCHQRNHRNIVAQPNSLINRHIVQILSFFSFSFPIKCRCCFFFISSSFSLNYDFFHFSICLISIIFFFHFFVNKKTNKIVTSRSEEKNKLCAWSELCFKHKSLKKNIIYWSLCDTELIWFQVDKILSSKLSWSCQILRDKRF